MFVSRGKSRRRAQATHSVPPTHSAAPRPILASTSGTFNVNLQHADGSTSHHQYYAPTPHNSAGDSPPPTESDMPPTIEETAPDSLPPVNDITGNPLPDEEETNKRERVSHMESFLAQQDDILTALLENYYDSNLLQPCACGSGEPCLVRCLDCLQAPICCRQCFLRQHRRSPTHWASVWNESEGFFEKTDICCVADNSGVYVGHGGEFCPHAQARQHFTLVDVNGIHATLINFCGCPDKAPQWRQLLRAGIFPATLQAPQTGFTLRVLEQWREYRHQGQLSMWDFVRILQRLADPWIPTSIPDVSKWFDNINRIFQYLDTRLTRGERHGADDVLPGDTERAYPHRPLGYLGTVHLRAEYMTLDGNFKANLFYKRDNGTDHALTDGRMYFPQQKDFEAFAKTHVVKDADKEVPCKAHIGAIRNQGKYRYKNTRVSGVVASACSHGLPAGFLDMLVGEAFDIVQYAFTVHLRQKNSPPYPRKFQWLRVQSYDSYCSWIVNQLQRVLDLYPEEEWLHDVIARMEGQIPASHITGHGGSCQKKYQPVYFPCRAHFHGESAETIWPHLNAYGPSLRQMNAGARHDSINFAMDSWNSKKIQRLAHQLGNEREDALRVVVGHISVLKQLSYQHKERVVEWSKQSRKCDEINGVISSVYQHSRDSAATMDDVLEALKSNHEKDPQLDPTDATAQLTAAEWIRWGMDLEHRQYELHAYLRAHREHPLQDAWDTICGLRDKLNEELAGFRLHQPIIFPSLELSPLDIATPEDNGIQVPSWILRKRTSFALDDSFKTLEISLRCGQANSQILAVQDQTIAHSIVRSSRTYDYKGQNGITRAKRKNELAAMLRQLEITVYNHARDALITLQFMEADAERPFPPMSLSDTSRKDTHTLRLRGDSRVVNGSVWDLRPADSGTISLLEDICGHAIGEDDENSDWEAADDDTARQMGTQSRKRAGPRRSEFSPTKRCKVTGKPSKTKEKKPKTDGWIWGEDALWRPTQTNQKVADFKLESERVQWFRAESEAFRWLEQYELKHVELWRVIERFRHDAEVWDKRAEAIKLRDANQKGAIVFARMQAAMWRHLQTDAATTFKNVASGAHAHWAQADSFADLVARIEASRETLFKWMDELGMERAYKNW
ncbi:hypothetical protein GGX14DRAFT_557999 [Mycena pura]|uniref:CxC2-like cysteine cluster KDZ transposase-associated domain-containing protein n=1 Tax=Mycena pura TaxID=153505 RepID=A0AAD7E232_9AGAR|nr:hypothetical protein GGX14DRAFT_557999 [Mycena pura]